jgi:regulator of protease activity HflC (stomatin/prohibitin superfamily)
MELQMAAERKKRAAILTSEGERDAAINSAQGQAQARILDAEAMKKSAILQAEAERQQKILQAEATAAALNILTEKLSTNPDTREALQFLLAQQYLDMGMSIGTSESSKVMFIDPRSIISTLEGVRSVIDSGREDKAADLTAALEKIDRHRAS